MIFRVSRRRLLLSVASLVLVLSGAAIPWNRAAASVSVAVSWDGLLGGSTEAVIATATGTRSAWEGGRIYTYSRVHVERAIAGTLAPGGEALVRTMGGIVGDVGQQVDGEAELVVGQASLLFLQPGPNGSFHVTARAQGQFPVIPATPQQPAHVIRARSLGGLVLARVQAPAVPAALAGDTLHGRPVEDAVREVLAAWGRTHPVPTP